MKWRNKKKGDRGNDQQALRPTEKEAVVEEAESEEPLMRFKVLRPFKDESGKQYSRRDGYLHWPYEKARKYIRRHQLMLSKEPEVKK